MNEESYGIQRPEKNSSHAAVVERMSNALRLIDQHGCTNYTDDTRCWEVGQERGAQYSADSWCDACTATAALNGPDTTTETLAARLSQLGLSGHIKVMPEQAPEVTR